MNSPSESYKNTIVLMYHGISLNGCCGTIRYDDFKKQIKFLKKFYEFVSLDDLGENHINYNRILLTFDDGYKNNFKYAVPILKECNIPAVFFVSHYHCQKNAYLWFSYIKALEEFYKKPSLTWNNVEYNFQKKQKKHNIQKIKATLNSLTPHPSEMYKEILQKLPPLDSFVSQEDILEYFSGMSVTELKLISSDPLFTLGIHTKDHPFLTKCTQLDLQSQIMENKEFLTQITTKPPTAIAYPSGVYDDTILKLCLELKIFWGFSVSPSKKTWTNQDIPRIGIYSPSLIKMIAKISTANILWNLGFKTG